MKILILMIAWVLPLCGEILNEAKEHLSRCKKTSFKVDELYPRSLAVAGEAISRLKTAQEAIDFAQRRLPFDHREPFTVEAAALCEADLLKEFPQFEEVLRQMEEPLYSRSWVVDFNGRRVSNIFYFQCWALFRCLSLMEKPRIVCDVGSGYGSTALLWMQNPIFSPDVYILVDFPECLFFAEIFLKSHLEGVDIVHLGGMEKIDFSKKGIFLCPIGKEGCLLDLPIDCIVNLGSLQHMSEEWVDYWMQWLDTTKARYFYSLNFGIVPLRKKFWLCKDATDWAPRLSIQWSCLWNRAEGPLWPPDGCIKCPGELEIVAERTGPKFSREELWEKFRQPRKLDQQGFAECLDLVRLCPEEEMIWELICRAEAEMGEDVPQEVRYLMKLLKNYSIQGLGQM